MTVVSIFACVLIFWALFARRTGSVLVASIKGIVPSALVARACAIGLVPLYAAQLLLLALQSRFENTLPEYAWMRSLPIPVFDDRADTAPLHLVFTGLYLGIAVMESLALAAIVLALRHNPTSLSTRMLALVAYVLGLLSLAGPVLATTDPYEYVATDIIGFQAYSLHNGEFANTAYEALARHIPVNRVDYGPLWMTLEIAQSKLGSSIYQKIEAMRFTNLAFVAVFLWLLARARLSRAGLAACALNPALWYFAVANPHAEIEALALLAGVYACAQRSKSFLATAFLIAAGLIKLPFVVIGGALLAPLRDARSRCSLWLLATMLALAISYLVLGRAYFANLSTFAAKGVETNWSRDWLAILPLVVAATALLVAARRSFLGTSWLFGQMAPLAAPWYLLWGIPYALASGGVEFYLIALPLAVTQAERLSSISASIVFVVITGLICDNVASRRQRWVATVPHS